MKNWRKLGEILQAEYDVAPVTIEAALEQQVEKEERLGLILCREHGLPSSVLSRALADQLALQFIEQIPDDADLQELIVQLPIAYVREHMVLPLAVDDHRLKVALSDPFAVEPLNDLTVLFALPVHGRSICTSIRCKSSVHKSKSMPVTLLQKQNA